MNDGTTAAASASLTKARTAGNGTNLGERGGKFLAFFLADEEYGLEILKVHEIIGMMTITPVPRTPEHIRGVINLRGKVIPIVDLRLKFGMDPIADTDQSCIIVVQTDGIEIGVVVDKVSEVLDIPGQDIEDTPSFGTGVSTDYILGIGKSEGRVKLLLDIDKALAAKDGTLDIGAAYDAGDDSSPVALEEVLEAVA
jgi:purine-binding chemotaxis protein CheW